LSNLSFGDFESPRHSTRPARILSTHSFLASLENLQRTTVLPKPWGWVRRIPRGEEIGLALSLLRHRKKFDVAIAPGHLPGLLFALLQRLLPGPKAHIILVDCLWSRETRTWRRILKRWQMQLCLKSVDLCVVLAKREIQAYSEEFGVDRSKFIFVPHHTSLHPHRFSFEISSGDYIFAGGNGDRDYRTFIDAIRPLRVPCVVACTDDRRLAGIELPSHVRRVRATPQEFRQLLAGAMMVVVPMEGGRLHSGGQQTFLNAMAVGKPVIVTDPEGASDYIEQGVTGLLVPPGDTIRLGEALRYLLDDENRRREVGERASASAERFSVENAYDQICSLADKLVENIRDG
jgi:glycosyltransferase involved in cell wall biosynthesis